MCNRQSRSHAIIWNTDLQWTCIDLYPHFWNHGSIRPIILFNFQTNVPKLPDRTLIFVFRIILFRHIHTTTTFWYYYIPLVYHSFLTLLVQHVLGYCNPSSGTFIKQFTRPRMASQYVLHWMCSNCKMCIWWNKIIRKSLWTTTGHDHTNFNWYLCHKHRTRWPC
jgi:hypothetical protein